MAEQMAIPQIFDSRLKSLRRTRAVKRMAKTALSFLLERCLDDVAERILDVNRRFESVILVGEFDLREALSARLPADRQPLQFTFLSRGEDVANLAPAKADLILSLLTLHSEDDLPGQMSLMARGLKKDGLFIAALFGGDSLMELRQSLYKTDEDIFDGTTARIFPMVTHSQAAPLLSRAGLNLPVVDMDRFTVNYTHIGKLVSDLRDIGETNILKTRSDKVLTKAYLTKLQENYAQLFGQNEKFKASFEILWLTGWAPDESQQKPLKPGSGKMHLGEALKAVKDS